MKDTTKVFQLTFVKEEFQTKLRECKEKNPALDFFVCKILFSF